MATNAQITLLSEKDTPYTSPLQASYMYGGVCSGYITYIPYTEGNFLWTNCNRVLQIIHAFILSVQSVSISVDSANGIYMYYIVLYGPGYTGDSFVTRHCKSA